MVNEHLCDMNNVSTVGPLFYTPRVKLAATSHHLMSNTLNKMSAHHHSQTPASPFLPFPLSKLQKSQKRR